MGLSSETTNARKQWSNILKMQKESVCVCVCVCVLVTQLCPTLCDLMVCSHLAPGQEYWSGFLFPSPEDLPSQGIEPGSLAFRVDSLLSEPPGEI